MGPLKYDYDKLLIKLAVITLSGFRCTTVNILPSQNRFPTLERDAICVSVCYYYYKLNFTKWGWSQAITYLVYQGFRQAQLDSTVCFFLLHKKYYFLQKWSKMTQ